jgi:hypothetical protein
MTKQQQILDLLKIDLENYEDVFFCAYWRWCESVSSTDAQTQMVMANASVNKYYRMEYAKCETEFLELIARYPNAALPEINDLYCKCTINMFNQRSIVLIENAKKTQIENDKARTPN